MAATDAEILKLEALRLQYQFWQTNFKALRLWQIGRIMQVLELEVQAAAASLGLPGWKIIFKTEAETKGGNIKSGIHIQVTSPFSKGVWIEQSGGGGTAREAGRSYRLCLDDPAHVRRSLHI